MIVDDGKNNRMFAPLWYYHQCGACGSDVRRFRSHKNAAWYQRRNLPVEANEIVWISTNGAMRCGDAPYGHGHNRGRFHTDLRHLPEGAAV